MKWQRITAAAWLIAWMTGCTDESATGVKIPTASEHIVVCINADPDNERAEYAIVVRGDTTGMGH
jgi:hypothetical protein